MKKFRLIFDKNKEIDWLNAMADQGWNLSRFDFGLYRFKPCLPGEFVYETDLKDRTLSISPEYRSILESQQLELIPSGSFWFLVRRKKSLGPLELYTDLDSRIAQYHRIGRLFKLCTLVELGVSLAELWGFCQTKSLILLFFALLLALFGAVLLQAIASINQEIARMESRIDDQSPLLFDMWGLFVMVCAFMVRSIVPLWIFALLIATGSGFILYGLMKMIQIRKQSDCQRD